MFYDSRMILLLKISIFKLFFDTCDGQDTSEVSVLPAYSNLNELNYNANALAEQAPNSLSQSGYYANFLCRCPNVACYSRQQIQPYVANGAQISTRVYLNPCPDGRPYLTPEGMTQYCSRAPSMRFNNCPDNYWCHIGITIETTCCCPTTVGPGPGPDICFLPPAPGIGNSVHLRYFYNSQTRTCQQFWYRGTAGNQNNFLTFAECENTCKKMPPIQEVNPCGLGQPLMDSRGRFVLCGPPNTENICYPNHWCHIGAGHDTTVCCPNAVSPEDACRLPHSAGEGSASLARWFFDMNTRQCTPFEYKGLKGNQNNFLSKEQCQSRCQGRQDETCGQGTTLKNPLGLPIICNHVFGSCPPEAWCHFGPPDEMPNCCSGAVSNPCLLNVAPGYGRHTLTRWFYNALSKRCETFNYFGRGGNQNNFLTSDFCQNTCIGPKPPPMENPCSIGQPLRSLGSITPMTCSFGTGCTSGYWCHIGARPETTVCCVGVSGQCQQFIYRGSKGNQNNFLNKEDCESTCLTDDPCVYPNPNPKGCSAMNPVCPTGQWCHLGANAVTTKCCAEAISNFCNLPLTIGSGKAGLRRFYFNAAAQRCEPFVYNGLKGNQNNFVTLQEYQAKCQADVVPSACPVGQPLIGPGGQQMPCTALALSSSCPPGYWCHYRAPADPSPTACCAKTTDNPCVLAPSSGNGPHRLLRYYYDAAKRHCGQFEYSGAKGNENNFPTFELCEASCGDYTNPCIGQSATAMFDRTILCSSLNKDACPVNYWCHIGATPQTTLCCPGATIPCSVPLAPGTGTARLKRWYFNIDSGSCQSFDYYGLGGNQNNFESKEECDKTCPSALCALSVDWGTICNNPPQIRYAYDRSVKSCIAFTYNGCGGNLNNFPTMQACTAVCSGTSYKAKL